MTGTSRQGGTGDTDMKTFEELQAMLGDYAEEIRLRSDMTEAELMTYRLRLEVYRLQNECSASALREERDNGSE